MKRTSDIEKSIRTAKTATSTASFAGAVRYAAKRLGAAWIANCLADGREVTIDRLESALTLARWEALEARRALTFA